MKGGKRTAKGRIINIDDVIAAAPHATAVGNMKINAQGDKLGPGGEVVQTREKRTRAYYKDHPQSSNRQVSLKGDMTEAFEHGHTDLGGLTPDTAQTAYENARTADTDIQEPEAPEPEEFDSPEPTGFREVELDNGDIEMQPYWDNDVEDTDPDTGSKLA